MSDDKCMPAMFVLVAIAFLGGMFLVGILMNPKIDKIKGEAVERGYAHWTPDPKSGEAVWSWNEPAK